jgi:hypothetical protein
MQKSIWDWEMEVIYTTSVFKSDTPLSVIACVWRVCGGVVVLAPLVYIRLF